MIPGIVAGQMPYPGAGGGSVNFANVVLLLNGDSTTDLSSYAHTLSVGPGAGVSFDTNDLVSGVVTSWIKLSAGDNTWTYSSAAEWGAVAVYTIDYWVYFDAVPGNTVCFASTDFTRFVQITGSGGNAFIGQQNDYGALSPATVAWASSPFYVRLVSDGVNVSRYINGNLDQTNSFSGVSSPGAKAFELLDLTAAGAQMRFAQIRLVQGEAANDPLDLTIPVQSAPWPTS